MLRPTAFYVVSRKLKFLRSDKLVMACRLAQLLRTRIGAGDVGFNSRAGQIGIVSPTARHRCDVTFELC